MGGRRDGSLMREKGQTSRGSRIAVAIVIGVLLGGLFALFFPHGLFVSDPPIRNRRVGNTDLKVPIFSPCRSVFPVWFAFGKEFVF